MTTATRDKLREILAGYNHSTFVGFTSLTRVKTPVDAPVIWKLNRISMCCGNYANAVNRRRAKEAVFEEKPFESKPRKWGSRVGNSVALIQHEKDGALKHYLSGQVLHAKSPIYLMEHAPLKPGKRPRLIGVEKAVIAQYLPEDRTAQAAADQGVSKAVVHRDFSLENLSLVSIGGEVLRIVD